MRPRTTMRRFALGCLVLASASLGCPDRRDADRIEILETRAYPAPSGEAGALVLVALRNPGAPTSLLGGRVAGATVALRRHAFEDGARVTKAVPDLPVPKDLEVRMHPEGVFYEVTELDAPPRPGETLELALLFRDRSELPVKIEVEPLPEASRSEP